MARPGNHERAEQIYHKIEEHPGKKARLIALIETKILRNAQAGHAIVFIVKRQGCRHISSILCLYHMEENPITQSQNLEK